MKEDEPIILYIRYEYYRYEPIHKTKPNNRTASKTKTAIHSIHPIYIMSYQSNILYKYMNYVCSMQFIISAHIRSMMYE